MAIKTFDDGTEFTAKHAAVLFIGGTAFGVAWAYGMEALENRQIRRMEKKTKKTKQMTENV